MDFNPSTIRLNEVTPPDGWREATLISVADIRFSGVDKKSYVSEKPVRLCNYMDVYNKEYIYGHEDFMRASASEAEISRFAIEAGDVIITKDSETPDDIGVPAVVVSAPSNLLCGYHLALIRPRRDQVDAAFLAKQLAHTRISRYYARLANGLTRYGLTNSVVENTPVWLPELDEQRNIAIILHGIDEAIIKTETLIAKLKAIKQGLLHDLLTRGLDDNGEIRDPEKHPEKFKNSPLGRIPKEWDIISLGDFADVIVGGTPSTAVAAFWGGNIPWMSSGDVHQRRISDVPGRITEKGLASSNATLVEPPSVVIALAGQGKTRGTVGITLSRLCGNQSIAFLKPRDNRLNTSYLFHNLDIRYEELRARSAGGGRAGLSKGILEKVPVPIPKPMEQARIANILDATDEAITKTQAVIVKQKSIKKGLMQDLLTGRVRVKVNRKENIA